jgi:hypothetical protein
MHFIDKQDDPTFGSSNFSENSGDSLLKVAPHLGSSQQSSHIEANHLLVLHVFGDIALSDPKG